MTPTGLCGVMAWIPFIIAVGLVGEYGVGSTLTCPPNCKDSLCHPGDGSCIECVPRFWGPSCNASCSPLCSSECDQVRGDCLSCRVGFWGNQCTETCPGFCDTSGCDIRTGRCVGDCVDGYFGLHCNETCSKRCLSCKGKSVWCDRCQEGHYGLFCHLTCPSTCEEGCTFITGNCHECIAGLGGLKCTDECKHRCSTCDQLTGSCTACRGSYCGLDCEQRCRYESQCNNCSAFDNCDKDTCTFMYMKNKIPTESSRYSDIEPYFTVKLISYLIFIHCMYCLLFFCDFFRKRIRKMRFLQRVTKANGKRVPKANGNHGFANDQLSCDGTHTDSLTAASITESESSGFVTVT